MCNSCVASSSLQASTEGYWEDPPDRQSFPTSAIRFEANTPHQQPRQISPAFESNASRTSCSIHVPQRSQVERGIWSDGTDIVLSSYCPDVQRYLARAHDALYLPPAPSEEVFVLAALEVFYAPTNPVHWMFWSDEKKSETADVVTRIVLHPRQRIQSSVKWNGSPEYLSILGNLHHSPAWREMFEHKHWFSVLAPPKVKSPVRGPTLRKRKPGQLALRDLSVGHFEDEDGADVVEPPPKKPRTKRATARKTSPRRGSKERSIESSTKGLKLEMMETPTPSSSLSHFRLPPPFFDQPAIADSETTAPQPCDVTIQIRKLLPKRASVRQKQRKVAPGSPTPVLAMTPSSSSATPSLPSMSSRSRSRSVSQASAETLVTSRPRSLSGVSTATAVEVVNAVKREGLIEVDEVEIELEEGENKPKTVETTPSFQMVTRASARAAAATTVTTVKPNRIPEKTREAGILCITDKEDQIKSERGRGENTVTAARRKRGQKGKR